VTNTEPRNEIIKQKSQFSSSFFVFLIPDYSVAHYATFVSMLFYSLFKFPRIYPIQKKESIDDINADGVVWIATQRFTNTMVVGGISNKNSLS